MLKSIDPLLNAEVLHALASMGHGNDLILCDANFPADAVARMTTYGKMLRIDADAPRAARAAAGIFAASLIPGLFYAWIGSRFLR